MLSRLELQTRFEDILDSKNVYYQPPESVKLQYPAIVYKRREFVIRKANNRNYMAVPGFEVTLIDKHPDSDYILPLLELPFCSHDRHYTADNLNHDVFRIYNYKGGNTHETGLGPDW